MDPQQRIMLEHAYLSLHAGRITRASLSDSETAIYVGVTLLAFEEIIQSGPLRSAVHAATGSAHSVVSGRLAFSFGTQGPCLTIETACSAALAACHIAAVASQFSECEQALASGVNLILTPTVSSRFATASMTSPRGRSHTFDSHADGYGRAETCCALTFQVDAENPIHLAGSSVRQDGRSASLTAPSGQAQQSLLKASLATAGMSSSELQMSEAHGTGTSLGDPIEAGSLVGVLYANCNAGSDNLLLGSGKANIGHGEPAAGATGLMKLALQLQHNQMVPNAQLRALNPHVEDTIQKVCIALPLQLVTPSKSGGVGVSSFGYSGTIAHVALRQELQQCMLPDEKSRTFERRRSFTWLAVLHPFLQTLESNEGGKSLVYRSLVHGAFRATVEQHVVNGRVIFPGAGYLEMAHAASTTEASSPAANVSGVFFLMPLALSEKSDGAMVSVEFTPSVEFQVTSSNANGSTEVEVHCAGSFAAKSLLTPSPFTLISMSSNCTEQIDTKLGYEAFDHAGLNYGPAFRPLQHAWKAPVGAASMSYLRPRVLRQGTQIHPADLDGALQLSALGSIFGDSSLRLPFAVDSAVLSGCHGSLWAGVDTSVGDKVIVQLASRTRNDHMITCIDGFSARELRAVVKREPWYLTEWHGDILSEGSTAKTPEKILLSELSSSRGTETLLLLSDEGAVPGHDVLATNTSPASIADVVSKSLATIVASPLQRETMERQGLFIAGVTMSILQLSIEASRVWLFTTGAQHVASGMAAYPLHAGLWGLARTVRAEAMRTVLCIDVLRGVNSGMLAQIARQDAPVDSSDTEVAVRSQTRHVPRLACAPDAFLGPVHLAYLPRGALSNMRIEPQGVLDSTLSPKESELSVRAVGLNFRDVLNVLGEYPGDPAPPGIDCSGFVTSAAVNDNCSLVLAGQPGFGLGVAALASVARMDSQLLATKPPALSFEEIATLPITWTTVHVALSRSLLSAGHRTVIHAAAGGVGLKAIEYAHWLHTKAATTAGGRHKHQQLSWLGVSASCSSRDGKVFCLGLIMQSNRMRCRTVLNSLSLDFISSSFAALAEGGSFQEIGKRGIWSYERQAAATSHTLYGAIAVDTDTANQPAWMHGLLRLLAKRASGGNLINLPFRSYDLEMQVEIAFRTLQSGLNTGKIVIRVADRNSRALQGTHAVTGGTGGLGLLTARWLAEQGASRLVLASRSGKRASGSDAEWARLTAVGQATEVSVQRCDTSDVGLVRRLHAFAANGLTGVWHAAGVLADGALPSQTMEGLRFVYAPKVHGAWALQKACASTPLSVSLHFSSVAALLGNPGQANYSTANACLDSLASCQRAHGSAATSVQWGPWAQSGMAVGGVAAARLAASGFGLIEPDQGLIAMRAAVRNGSSPVLGVVPLVWSKYLEGSSTVPSFLKAFAPRTRNAAKKQYESTATGGVSLEAVLAMTKRTAGGDVDTDAPLMEAGIDSLGAVELRNQLQRTVGNDVTVPSTIVFDYPTVRSLASFLAPSTPAEGATKKAGSALQPGMCASVDLCGMSAAVPGGAETVDAAWRVAASGSDMLSEVPAARWLPSELPPTSESIEVRRRHGGFLRAAHLFENASFGISSAEAIAMDPQQRILLHSSFAALCSGGMDRMTLNQSLTAIYIGISSLDFNELLLSSPLGGTVYAATGSNHSITSGRVSYALGTQGPCLTLDTACSAALAAVHVASASLCREEAVHALSSGVNMVISPVTSSRFAMAGMTSPRGRCHTFDRGADGYGRSEACCSSVLSIGRGMSISIAGSSVRQDGRSASLTAPSGQAQAALLTSSLANSCSDACNHRLGEAHGTGTGLGDPIETSSLASALLAARGKDAIVMALGGVKANIGHAEPTAGLTGLVKLATALDGSLATPNAQLRVLNPMLSSSLNGAFCALAVQIGDFRLNATVQGGVSSFGYSGTIVHAILSHRQEAAALVLSAGSLIMKRHSFTWRDARHPFAQSLCGPASDDTSTFRSPVCGVLHALVADHIVQGRVIFPAVGYLEMASSVSPSSALQGVFFLLPLAVETPGLLVEFVSSDGRFEVRSGEDDTALMDAGAHCAGAFATEGTYKHVDGAAVRSSACLHATAISDLYDAFADVELQYGPSYRTLTQGWGGMGDGMARLRTRKEALEGVSVHPADLDDGLCAIRLIASSNAGRSGETRLPFAVDNAQLKPAQNGLWAVRKKILF